MPRKPAAAASGDYDEYKSRQAEISRQRSAEGREIGPLPGVQDPARKARGRASLLAFARDYFPRRFPWPFAAPHEEAARRIEQCTEDGGLFAEAMPRGMGKTTLAEVAVIRAAGYGLRRFALLLQATEKLSARSLKKIQRELETNDLLLADFPEMVYPIRALGRIHNRAKGQTLDGRPTMIEWTADGVVLPTVPGAASSGAVIAVAGITGAVRGLSFAGPDGDVIRPDLVVIDDAQTRESARSPTQTGEREAVITDDVLNLAGPDVSMAAVMLCTVIYPDDLSDRFLSPDKHPEWQGLRTRMVERFPDRTDLWDRYAEVRRESFRSGDRGRRGTAFYVEHRAEMDKGAVVSWPDRVKRGDVSAVQSAMNLHLDNPRGFRAEYQNDPAPDDAVPGLKQLDAAAVARRAAGVPRHTAPREAVALTAMIDLGTLLHWYAVVAWDATFGGVVVDYGPWPRQARAVFAASDPGQSLLTLYPTMSEPQRVYAGLEAMTPEVLGRVYPRPDGGEMKVERCLIDCGWNSAAVYQFCRASPFSAVIYPSKGVGRSTTARGVSEWKPRPGEKSGHHWRLTAAETGRGRMVQFDPDEWKSFLFARLTTPPGGGSALLLHGASADPHQLLGEHAAAEFGEPATLRGQTFDKWKKLPHQPDNHLLDALVGAAVAASVQGVTFFASATPPPPPAPRPVISLKELRAQVLAARRAPAAGPPR